MANDFYTWSQTAADNATSDDTINWAENQSPDTVNDSARNMMKRAAEFRYDLAPTRSSGGSSNAYTVTSAAGGSGSYRDGEIVTFIADRANTSSCTLNVNSRGAVAFRPAVGVEFKANEIQANQPLMAFYRLASNEWLGLGTGYHVDAMTSGLLTQAVSARLIKIGTPVLSISPTVNQGYIRLTESTQTLNKADWPELSAWLASLSTPYPWGSASTTFNLPPAAGYFLRFAALSSSIDTAGARSAGAVQLDQTAAHTHANTATVNDPGHIHPELSDTFLAAGGGTTIYRVGGNNNGHIVGTGFTGISVTINNASSGTGTETRAKNVAMHVEIFASTALSAGTIATFGWPLAWDTTTTSGDPGTGRVRCNNATLGSATALYISETDAWGADIAGVLGAIANGSILRLSKVGAQSNYVMFTASGSTTDAGAWRTITGAVTASAGSFSASDSLALELMGQPGATGATGPSGGGIPWTWDIGTSASDPGSGKVRVDNATLSAVTNIYINNSDANGNSETTWLDELDDSTSTVKGYIQLTKASAASNSVLYSINSVSGTSFRTIAVTYVSGAATFSAADSISVTANRTGDKGATGSTGSNGTNGTNGTNGVDAGIRWIFASSTSMADPSAGNLRFNDATLASVTAVAISYSCGETGNPSVANTVKAWDDSSTTAHRGYLIVKKASAPQNYIVFDITGALTDNTTWAQLAVTVVDSAGSLSASDTLSVQFSRTGDAGSGSLSFMTANGIMYATGTSAGTSTAAATDGQILIGRTGTTPALAALSGDITMTNGGVTAIGATKVTNAMLAGSIDLATKMTGVLPSANGGAGTVSGIVKANGSGTTSAATAGTDYMKPDTTSTISKGFTLTPNNIGTVSSGTTTPDPANGNYQYMTNNGAFTLAAPSSDCAVDILVTNGASAGSITFSGFTVGSSTGSALTTTDTNKFKISIVRINSVATYSIYALQ